MRDSAGNVIQICSMENIDPVGVHTGDSIVVAPTQTLANKEYQMMELLLRHPRQLIPTERFLERIWGYDSEVELNVVWVYISYLRKKLTALQADIQIKATRNAGYSLEERT